MGHDILELVDSIDFKNLMVDAMADGLDQVIGDEVTQTLKKSAAVFVAGVAGELASAVAGPFVQAALASLLGASDQTARKLDLLINEPFNTGIVEVKRAVFLKPATAADQSQRINDLESAIHDLDRAYSMSPGESGRQAYIRLIQGLAAQTLGERQYSAHFLGEASGLFAPCLITELDRLNFIYSIDPSDPSSALDWLPNVSEAQLEALQQLISKSIMNYAQFTGNWSKEDSEDAFTVLSGIELSLAKNFLAALESDWNNGRDNGRFSRIMNLYLCAGGDSETIIKLGEKLPNEHAMYWSPSDGQGFDEENNPQAKVDIKPRFLFPWTIYFNYRVSRLAD